ncbi:MAG: aldo/keto reductase [Candidatus Latescibacteria bacterium]|nr:aldo/keto reductase [Candidatus Latescibacterota bacterium]
MQTTTLGRTNLTVSTMGMGGGGPSQLGKRTGKTQTESATILRQAFDAGVNFVDTAEGYGTEPTVAEALEGRDRTSIIISTKKSTRRKEVTPQTLEDSLNQSLECLGTDYIDIYSLHGVVPQDYDYLVADVYPTLKRAQEQGKIRFIGITEMFNEDTPHAMSKRAVEDNLFDVMMIGFNIINQSGRDAVLKKAIENNIGIQVMFAVRKALSQPDYLIECVAGLIESGQLDPNDLDDLNAPLNFLLQNASTIPVAAYRFCRDEPGTHVILSGTGNPDHLRENIAAFDCPPLPNADTERLKHIFRNVDSITGQ